MRPRLAAILISTLTLSLAGTAVADDSLHARIDQLIAARAGDRPIAPRCDDATFARRVWLDFAGVIPTAEDLRTFLDDTSPDKRAKLIESLTTGPMYARRMTELFHVMLMERRGDDDAWLSYLRASFEANKPWDQIAREILAPNPDDEATRASGYFYVKRLEKYGQNPTDYPGLTRDVGRLFAGRDLQCAECHNHLFVRDYKQRDFQGLFAFFKNISIRQGVKFPAINEGLTTAKVEYASVFNKQPNAVGPLVPGAPGGEDIEVPTFAKGEEWAVAPDRKNKVEGVPKFSPLHELATRMPTAENEAFTRNVVNRLWFVMMGRGIVHPLDLFNSENPPTHPELLDLLAKEFAAHKFDIRWMLGELALTETYQRASMRPAGASEDPIPLESYNVAIERRLSAEQLLWSVLRATGEYDRYVGKDASTEANTKALDDLRKRFVNAFANQPRDPEMDFAPALSDALFVMNDEKLLDLLTPRDGNLIDRAMKIEDDGKAVEVLFMTVLSRPPTDEERTELTAHLAKYKDQRAKALGRIAWAMLASTEFVVNH